MIELLRLDFSRIDEIYYENIVCNLNWSQIKTDLALLVF